MSAGLVARSLPAPTKRPPQGSQPHEDGDRKLLPHEIRWRQFFSERGFVQTPRDFFTRLPAGLSGIEHAITGQILSRTLGAVPTRSQPHRPEFFALTIPELARIFDYSVNSISAALVRLVKWGVLAVRPVATNKRANEYACCIEQWGSLDVRAMRKERATLKNEDPLAGEEGGTEATEDHESAAAARSFGTARRCKPGATATITFEQPAKSIKLVNDTGLPVSLSVSNDGGALSVRVAAEQTEGEASVKNTPNKLGESTPGKAQSSNGNTPNKLGESKVTSVDSRAVSEALGDWQATLSARFARQIGQPLPDALAAAQFTRLDAAQVDMRVFWDRVQARSRAFKDWGLLPRVVDDVVAAAPNSRPAQATAAGKVDAEQITRYLQRAATAWGLPAAIAREVAAAAHQTQTDATLADLRQRIETIALANMDPKWKREMDAIADERGAQSMADREKVYATWIGSVAQLPDLSLDAIARGAA